MAFHIYVRLTEEMAEQSTHFQGGLKEATFNNNTETVSKLYWVSFSLESNQFKSPLWLSAPTIRHLKEVMRNAAPIKPVWHAEYLVLYKVNNTLTHVKVFKSHELNQQVTEGQDVLWGRSTECHFKLHKQWWQMIERWSEVIANMPWHQNNCST